MTMNKVENKIYCFWTGDNPITPNRIKGLETMQKNIGVPIEFLDTKGIERKVLPEAPLHPAYKYLSCNHKSDYLRCYFMHHFGGGYADIKPYTANNNWKSCFEYINRYADIDIIGQHDSKGGIAVSALRNIINAEMLVACGWMICRPHSRFTTEWYKRVMKKMDERIEVLKQHPATEPFGGKDYPIEWAEVCGRIYHQVQYDLSKVAPKAIRNCLRTGWQGFGVPYR